MGASKRFGPSSRAHINNACSIFEVFTFGPPIMEAPRLHLSREAMNE